MVVRNGIVFVEKHGNGRNAEMALYFANGRNGRKWHCVAEMTGMASRVAGMALY